MRVCICPGFGFSFASVSVFIFWIHACMRSKATVHSTRRSVPELENLPLVLDSLPLESAPDHTRILDPHLCMQKGNCRSNAQVCARRGELVLAPGVISRLGSGVRVAVFAHAWSYCVPHYRLQETRGASAFPLPGTQTRFQPGCPGAGPDV